MSRFDTLLVANRGEIAVRVLRTARDLGYRCVAVYSDADRDAPHVAMADEAVRLGPGPAAESYLDVAALLDAARRTGAQAVHPGYGFLSENAAFAQRCAEAGLVFVGPPPEAIRIMGDKVQAKRKMIEAGVPTAPGYLGVEQDDARLRAEAAQLGTPLLVKAVAGGGGRGMRRVSDLAQLDEAISGARAEASSAFGNGDLFLERLVTGARHIEVQVFADEHGGVVHLGERECSVQRRHQKIIEEAPSPAVGPDLRRRLGDAAVAAARAIDYRGAGTVEFLLDDDGAFYFLEMNTRLQVEHPVTELVTGQDLVYWQLAVAQGERLPLAQEQIALSGHAIEARLYAEDPAAGFLPQTGPVHVFELPDLARVRVDAGLRAGQSISSFYDPMVAKVIGSGATRGDAIRALIGGLRGTTLFGPVCNRDFLVRLLRSEMFSTARFKTDTLDLDGVDAFVGESSASSKVWALAAALRVHGDGDGWNSRGPSSWPVTLVHGSTTRTLEVRRSGARMTVHADDEAGVHEVEVLGGERTSRQVEVDGVRTRVHVHVHARTLWLDVRGESFAFEDPAASSAREEAASDGQVRAPIAGKVLTVDVTVGQPVLEGQRLLSVEAMKMEHRVVARRAGTVVKLAVAVGEQVASGQVVCVVDEDVTAAAVPTDSE